MKTPERNASQDSFEGNYLEFSEISYIFATENQPSYDVKALSYRYSDFLGDDSGEVCVCGQDRLNLATLTRCLSPCAFFIQKG